ncbi:hypothetical protein [Thiomicrorhabdus lithotrophica]|uniref:Uncharacterized protein n=1 Tax=Thiomicrorhabdus lithotrophica TaxID=2949997 RepID=A0ABY8C892_9GAMM|nr:hypothetical protein [Thiomicrorhabdus lithotrophica]WEJ62183.1 hypothetical protein NR989_09195 [Thiomicrorhabdus lithotrophica]
MPIIYKEVEVEVEAELDDFETEDLIEELRSRKTYNQEDSVPAAWFDLNTTGIPVDVVLHDLFKDCTGYDYFKLQQLIETKK